MIRRTTNFGAYEAERIARLPRWRRLASTALRIALLGVAVALAGLFLFPSKAAHAGRSCDVRKPTTESSAKGLPHAGLAGTSTLLAL